MNKKKLRSLYKNKRAEISSLKIQDLSIEIANQILDLPIWGLDNFHIFLGVDKLNEINTNFIISILQGRDKNIIVPKVISDGNLDHYLLTDSTKLKINQRNILEPISGFKVKEKSIQVVFVPLLAYDIYGNRVGYGKGYYDRYLNKYLKKFKNILTVGVAFSFQKYHKLPINNKDFKLNYILTEKGIY